MIRTAASPKSQITKKTKNPNKAKILIFSLFFRILWWGCSPQVLQKLNISFVHQIQLIDFFRCSAATRRHGGEKAASPQVICSPQLRTKRCVTQSPLKCPLELQRNISLMHALLKCRGRGIPPERSGELQPKANRLQI